MVERYRKRRCDAASAPVVPFLPYYPGHAVSGSHGIVSCILPARTLSGASSRVAPILFEDGTFKLRIENREMGAADWDEFVSADLSPGKLSCEVLPDPGKGVFRLRFKLSRSEGGWEVTTPPIPMAKEQ